jgi:hypothetical protein
MATWYQTEWQSKSNFLKPRGSSLRLYTNIPSKRNFLWGRNSLRPSRARCIEPLQLIHLDGNLVGEIPAGLETLGTGGHQGGGISRWRCLSDIFNKNRGLWAWRPIGWALTAVILFSFVPWTFQACCSWTFDPPLKHEISAPGYGNLDCW